MQGIKDKKVLITAGAAGLGKATAIAMMNAGAKVHVCDIDTQALAALKQAYPMNHPILERLTPSSIGVTQHAKNRQCVSRCGDLCFAMCSASKCRMLLFCGDFSFFCFAQP